jgi:hypothetical protein
MHPYFAQELARERQREQLGRQQFRHRKRKTERKRSAKAKRAPKASLMARARHSLGRALVALGTRLLGGAPAGAELFTTRR